MSIWVSLKQSFIRLARPIINFSRYYSLQTHYVEGRGGKLEVGERVYLTNTLINVESGSVFIGDRCIFGYNVMLLTGRHEFHYGERYSTFLERETNSRLGAGVEVPRTGYDISVGEGTWIASGAIVTGGVKIGKNSIISAGCVVSRDIPDYSIVSGIPARIVGDTRMMRSDL